MHLKIIVLLQFTVDIAMCKKIEKPAQVYQRFTGPPEIVKILKTLYSRSNLKPTFTLPVRTKRNDGSTISILNINEPKQIPEVKKWQVGRFSHKNYELINMLWKKTNVFIDLVTTTELPINQQTTEKSLSKPGESNSFERLSLRALRASTPSYMEFYYLDESLDNVKHQELTIRNNKFDALNQLSPSLFLSLNINDATSTPSLNIESQSLLDYFIPYNHILTVSGSKKMFKHHYDPLVAQSLITINLNRTLLHNVNQQIPNLTHNNHIPVTSNYINDTFKELNVKMLPLKSKDIDIEGLNISNLNSSLNLKDRTTKDKSIMGFVSKSTTLYDKIKFFEVYDSFTENPALITTTTENDDERESNDEQAINSVDNAKVHKLTLEDIERDMPDLDANHKSKHIKKHVTDGDVPVELLHNNTECSNLTTVSIKSLESQISSGNCSTLAKWSDYPYIAVYVYERYQVQCDAAALSAHWLIAAGACLSRHYEDPNVEARSAFVSYCSEHWWNPERIAYVKYSIVHPKFNPKDKAHRHLYNIGVIQVVSSMSSSCFNLRPVPIMSHQFTAVPNEGYHVQAIGWGLDRYDMRYSSTHLPRTPLTVYDGVVYSDTCPGNSVYRSINEMDQESVKNIYCLSLPPYFGEERDPIHGGLLLVDGKLTALYLQEERRQWGVQSAQYTGIWRLAPWLNDVITEPEEIDYMI